jgi:hypothetical protein
MTDLKLDDLTAERIHSYIAQKEQEKRTAAAAAAEHAQAEREELRKKFEAEDLPGDALHHVFGMVQKAVDHGDKQVMVMHFPSWFLPDNGRSINTGDKDWPEHLSGFAARAYQFYEKELRPRGFKLSASVIDFPGGKPGNIGFFLGW